GGGAELAGESTRILGADEARPSPAAAAKPAPRTDELAGQATAILDAASLNLPAMMAAAAAQKNQVNAAGPRTPPVAQPAFPNLAPPPASQLDANPPTDFVDALPYAAQRGSTLW